MAKIFELPLKDGNITPEKPRISRQMQLRDKTSVCSGSSLSMRSFAIKEAPSPLPTLYATLPLDENICKVCNHLVPVMSFYLLWPL